MKKGLTEIVFILDRSGSMSGLENDTIGGFNSMIDRQKETPGETLISTVLFDDQMKVLHDRVPLEKIGKMTRNDYYVGGSTALLDAVGRAIRHINSVQKSLPEDERPEKTMFVITTDGQENSSVEYSYEKIKKMVEKKQEKKHWEFLFLGANIDAIGTAAGLGIKPNRSVNYISDGAGTTANFKAVGKAVMAFRCAPCVADADAMLEGWDEEIVKDYKARKKNSRKFLKKVNL